MRRGRVGPRGERALAIVGAAIALAAFVALGLEVVAYEGTRARWRAMRDRLEEGAPGYDPAASDALYVEVEAHRADARRDAWIAAVALVVAASAAGALGGRRGPDSEAIASGGRLLAACAIDVAALGAGLSGALAIAASSPSIAAADALFVVLPAAAIAALAAACARGRTPGMWVARVERVEPPGAPRALLGAFAIALSAAWMVIGGVVLVALVLGRRPPRAAILAPHLALGGLAPRAPLAR